MSKLTKNSSHRTMLVFDLEKEADAIRIAIEMAAKTGHTITVCDADGIEIKSVSPILH